MNLFLSYKQKIVDSNGEHSNFDECKTGIYVTGLHSATPHD